MGLNLSSLDKALQNPKFRNQLVRHFGGTVPATAPAPAPTPAPAPPPVAPTVTPYVPEYQVPQPSFGDQMGTGAVAPPPAPEPPPPPDIYSSVGADGSAGATGFKSKKSSWKTSGQSTKGTNNLKLQIQKSASGTGLNITG